MTESEFTVLKELTTIRAIKTLLRGNCPTLTSTGYKDTILEMLVEVEDCLEDKIHIEPVQITLLKEGK